MLSGPFPTQEILTACLAAHVLLDSNNFTGAFPTDLSRFWSNLWTVGKIVEVDISGNYGTGPLPDLFSGNSVQFSGLAQLNIASNQFDGPVPSSLFRAPFLTALYLDGNQLSGSLPDATKACVLETLSLNTLPGINGSIPTSYGAITTLNELFISGTSISGSIPVSFGSLTNLRMLVLADNALTGLIPSTLEQLNNLAVCSLSGSGSNNFTCPKPAQLPPACESNYCTCLAGAYYEASLGACVSCARGTYAPRSGASYCLSNPKGYFSSADGASVSQCGLGTYLAAPDDPSCQSCPFGVVSTVLGGTACFACPPGSAWVNASYCAACPRDSKTSQERPDACECVAGFYDKQFGAVPAAPTCVSCPLGGLCTTGTVRADVDYWRESLSSDTFYKCRVGRCLEERAASPFGVGRHLQQMPNNSSNASSLTTNCVEGNTGPLCSLCIPGYAIQSGVCAPCPEGNAWEHWSAGAKAALLTCLLVFAVVFLAFAFFQPVVPMLRTIAAAAILRAQGCFSATTQKCFRKTKSTAAPNIDPAHHDAQAAGEQTKSSLDVAVLNAQAHQVTSIGAFGLGVLLSTATGDNGDDAAVEEDDDEQEHAFDIMESAERLLDRLLGYVKVLISFYQIVSTFIHSLDIPWPNVFKAIMSRVSLINLNLLQLPKAACLNPSVSFYQQFVGYVVSLLGAVLGVALLWCLGSWAIAPLTLRGLSRHEREDRLSAFHSVCLSRLLLLLYVCYPGVSVTIFSMFSCTSLDSGVSYLNADFQIHCYTLKHYGYIGGAIVCLLFYTVGIPLFFVQLLRHFRVPAMAALLERNAWLREAAEHVWSEGIPQPPCDLSKLCCENITDLHLELLHAVLVRKVTHEEAVVILNGEQAAPAAEERPRRSSVASDASDEPSGSSFALRKRSFKEGLSNSLRLSRTYLQKALNPEMAARTAAEVALEGREQKLESLLLWCRTSGELSIPVIQWGSVDGDEENESAEAAPGDSESLSAARDTPDVIHTADLPRLVSRATKEVGFLFRNYHAGAWYWESIELVRKLVLTSILALIAPGSAGQVVVGLLIAFVTLMLNLALKPYKNAGLNLFNTIAQFSLFFFLFVGLLLKVNLDGDSSVRDLRDCAGSAWNLSCLCA